MLVQFPRAQLRPALLSESACSRSALRRIGMLIMPCHVLAIR